MDAAACGRRVRRPGEACHDRGVRTLLLYGLIAIAVAVAIIALLIVFLPPGQMIAPVVTADTVPDGLPATGTLAAADVAKIRLPVALRGYRMAEVDAVLDRLATELELRDQRLAALDRVAAVDRAAVPDRLPGLDRFSAAPDGRSGPELTEDAENAEKLAE
jgi:DivIVA domain-containing protein